MNPDPAILDELVRRTVQAVHPVQIILFGSAARGDMGPNSDLDTLVVVPNDRDCHEVTTLLIRGFEDLVQSLFLRSGARDPATIAAVAIFLVIVSLVSCILPALRAACVSTNPDTAKNTVTPLSPFRKIRYATH